MAANRTTASDFHGTDAEPFAGLRFFRKTEQPRLVANFGTPPFDVTPNEFIGRKSSMSAVVELPAEFPKPAERPDADIVIYDGNCNFCRGQILRLLWWDCQGKLAYLSLHDPEVAKRFPDLTHEQMMQQMYVVDAHGNKYGGAEALRHLTTRLRRLWWLAPLMYFPFSMPLWKWLYRQVALRRYRLSGTAECHDGACALHGRPEQPK